jgi:hypothetical protein
VVVHGDDVGIFDEQSGHFVVSAKGSVISLVV